MTTYYKATRPDGRDFMTGTIDYGAALVSGEVVRHPTSKRKVRGKPATYLSVSTEPADCTGFAWPCRLFRVEPVGRVGTAPNLRNKRTTLALRVVEELPAWMAFGPNGEDVARLIDSCRTITPEQARRLYAAWGAARDAARDVARGVAWGAARGAAQDAAWGAARDAARDVAQDAAWGAARDAARGAAQDAAQDAARDVARDVAWGAARDAARGAARDAAWALVVRDLIAPEQFDTLTGPWVSVMGRTWEAS
jgi:hypothetical protein